jgi:hypothetical protein
MANVFAPDANNKLLHTGEYGNVVQYVYEVEKAANAADVIFMGKIPAGIRVTNVRGIFADTGTGNTLDVGYAPADGAAPVAAANYWWNDLDAAAAAVDGVSAALPIRFERDVWLQILVNAQNFTGTPKLILIVTGINEGVK